jgi:hypothetical protein
MHVKLRNVREVRLRRLALCASGLVVAGGLVVSGALVASAAVPTAGQIVPVSVDAASRFIAGSTDPAVSGDGRWAAFVSESNASNVGQIFLKDLVSGTVRIISTESDGVTLGDAASRDPEVSFDGSYITYVSDATNLTSVPTNNSSQVYRYDTVADLTEMVSVDDQAMPEGAVGGAVAPSISDDGSMIAFASAAPLGTGTTVPGTASQIWVRDMDVPSTQLVSHQATPTTSGAGASTEPAISPDGSTIVWQSLADDLVASPRNAGALQVFARASDGTISMVTQRSGVAGDLASEGADVGDDGSVSFLSFATNLTPVTLTLAHEQVLLHRPDGSIQLVSHKAADPAAESAGAAYEASLSADGQVVLFNSEANDISPIAGNGIRQLYQWTAADNASQMLSLTTAGVPAAVASEHLELSSNGLVGVFQSQATDLISSPTSPGTDEAYAVGIRSAVPTATPTPTGPGTTGGGSAAAGTAGAGASGNRLASTGIDQAEGAVVLGVGLVLLMAGTASALVLGRRARRTRQG